MAHKLGFTEWDIPIIKLFKFSPFNQTTIKSFKIYGMPLMENTLSLKDRIGLKSNKELIISELR